MKPNGTYYEIERANGRGEFYGTPSGDWWPAVYEYFATEEDALAAIEELHAMREWANVILAVKPSNSRWVSTIVYPEQGEDRTQRSTDPDDDPEDTIYIVEVSWGGEPPWETDTDDDGTPAVFLSWDEVDRYVKAREAEKTDDGEPTPYVYRIVEE